MASASASSRSGYRALFEGAQRARSLAIILMLLIATLDVLIVATAMPTVLKQLGDVHLYSWVFSAYTLGGIASLPVFGSLTGRQGLVRTMVISIAIFCAGAVVAALANSMLMLVAGRAVQGLGSGGLIALPNLIIARYYSEELRPRAVALTSGVWGLSSLTGPLVGGLLLERWGWHAIFWLNLPVCALILALGLLGLRGADRADPQAEPANLRSPLLLTLTTGLLLAVPTTSGPLALGLLALGLAAAAAYVLTERRSGFPIIPGEVWRAAGPLGASLAVLGLVAVAFFAAETFLPLLLQGSRTLSAASAGVVLSVSSIGWTSGTFWVSQRDDLGPRRKTLLGIGLVCAGIGGLVLLIVFDLPTLVAFVSWGLAGLGMGMAVATCTTVVLDAARGPEAGRLTAAAPLVQGLGTSVGATAAGAVAALGFGTAFDSSTIGAEQISEAMRKTLERGVLSTLLLGLAVAALTLLLSGRLAARRRQRHPESSIVNRQPLDGDS
jgi:MFS family permease